MEFLKNLFKTAIFLAVIGFTILGVVAAIGELLLGSETSPQVRCPTPPWEAPVGPEGMQITTPVPPEIREAFERWGDIGNMLDNRDPHAYYWKPTLEDALALNARLPLLDFAEAHKRGDDRLIARSGGQQWSPDEVIGGTCSAPVKSLRFIDSQLVHSDVGRRYDPFPPEPDVNGLFWPVFVEYARVYNQTLMQHPEYPYAHICQPTGGPVVKLSMNFWMLNASSQTDVKAEGIGETELRKRTQAASIYSAAYFGDEGAVLRFIGEGVAVDAPDEFGKTALFYAATGEQTEMVKMLMAKGAKVDSKMFGWVHSELSPEMRDLLGLTP